MYLNPRLFIASFCLAIASSSLCTLVPSLESSITTFSDSSIVYAVNWCPTCNWLAVGGADNTYGLVGIYQIDQTPDNLSLTVTSTLGIEVDSVAWCPSCNILAAGGSDSRNGIIQLYSFDQSNPGNLVELTGSSTVLGGLFYHVRSLDWCNECSLLAAVSLNEAGCPPGPRCQLSIFQVYSFNSTTGDLADVDGTTTSSDGISQIKWCPDCKHLVAAGGEALYVYDFYQNSSPALVLSTSADYNGASYYSVDVCDNCEYIAAGGYNGQGYGVVDIYKFESQPTPTLTLVISMQISSDSSIVEALEWCQDCDNLAVAGIDIDTNDGLLQLYHFDSSTKTLTLIQPQTLSFDPYSLDWCGNCCNLAVGGQSETGTTGFIQLLRNTACLTPPTNLTAQKIFQRFPTQVDIINRICWAPVINAVAYNVYADAALTILLATIPAPSVCYSQHRIAPGKTITYYVTSVNADGTQSAPAVVTI